jgi:hypothetical protein
VASQVFQAALLGNGRGSFFASPDTMPLLERVLIAIVALLAVAALVGLIRHYIGRNAAHTPPPGAAGAGRFWW